MIKKNITEYWNKKTKEVEFSVINPNFWFIFLSTNRTEETIKKLKSLMNDRRQTKSEAKERTVILQILKNIDIYK